MLSAKTITFYDLETTGLDSYFNAVIQFGAITVAADNLEVIGEHSFNVLPFANAIIDPEACKINGYDPVKWQSNGALAPIESTKRISKILEGTTLAGHNIKKFDNQFIARAFDRAGGPMFFSYSSIDDDCIDTKLLAGKLGYTGRRSSLWSLCLEFGIVKSTDSRGDHNALVDCRLCLSLYKELIKLQNNQSRKHGNP